LSSGKPKPTRGSRDNFLVGYRLRIEKSFALQKTDGNSWRCDTNALPPVEAGTALRGGP
jgi:hypothetical protein